MPSDGTQPESATSPGRLRRWLTAHRYALALVVVFTMGMFVGIPVFDTVDRYFSSDAFCMTGCHLMDATVGEELRQSDHWTRPSGVRASCGDCHVSEGLTAAMWDHIVGTRELFSFVFKGIRTPEEFQKVREEDANRVRLAMVANDSKNCRSCHTMEAIKPERKRGQTQHADALKTGATCIACHYNLVHKEVEPSKEFLEAIGESETSDFTLGHRTVEPSQGFLKAIGESETSNFKLARKEVEPSESFLEPIGELETSNRLR